MCVESHTTAGSARRGVANARLVLLLAKRRPADGVIAFP
jgi:hypothetical protein